MIYNIWWAYNNVIFNENLVLPKVTKTLTLHQVVEFKENPRGQKMHNLVLPSLDYEISMGYFDGASQGHPPKCGVGVVLLINQNHYIYIRYAPGGGTNNRVELIALWTLLETTKQKDIRKLHVLGDSKLAIDWAQGKLSI
jgi:hypothetical protein